MSEPNYKGPEYPTEAHGSIPAFNSYEEEAEFWDTHSISDFKNETKPVKVVATRGYSANVQVRFEPDTDHELDAIARERGMKKSIESSSACIGSADQRPLLTSPR